VTGEENVENGVAGLKTANGNESIEQDDKFIEVVQNPILKGQGKSSSKSLNFCQTFRDSQIQKGCQQRLIL
jgi:hypothetical protein